MKIYRDQSFQQFKPKLNENGERSQLCDMPDTQLRRIQKGSMHFRWRGVLCHKNPFDLSLYSELLWELKPASIIEIGYKFGGSALWFADQSKIMEFDPKIYCVDVTQREEVDDPRIEFVQGDATKLGEVMTPDVIDRLPHPWLIIEDADHHYLTTKGAIDFLAPLMEEGDYLTIEDGICDTFGQEEKYDGGPNRAIFEFIHAHPDAFEVDAHYCDFFGNNVTWCTNGYLRRTAVPI